MKYYVKFQEGKFHQIEGKSFLDDEIVPDGWHLVNEPNASEKFYRLENGSAVVIPDSEMVDFINSEKEKSRLALIRIERDDLLSKSDWTQGADSPLSEEKKTEWAAYRQSLRDLPLSITDALEEIAWPTPPSK